MRGSYVECVRVFWNEWELCIMCGNVVQCVGALYNQWVCLYNVWEPCIISGTVMWYFCIVCRSFV